jgi:serine/threonine-protein phosphatase 2B catalytic subunit
MDSFDLFPLSCVVNGKFIALHGGISPEMKTVTHMNDIVLNS